MAKVLIRASTASNRIGGWVGQSTGGNKVCVFTQSFQDGPIWAYEDINNTPSAIGSSQGNSVVFGDATTTLMHIDAAIDSSNVIHVIAICDESGGSETRVVAYNTISNVDSSPAWGSWETILTAFTNAPNTMTGCSVDVDSNDKPHVLFVDFGRTKGTNYGKIYYSEKTGASWSTPVALVSTSAETDYRYPQLSMKASDDAEAVYMHETNVDAHKNTLTSGSWGADTQIYNATTQGWTRFGPTVAIDSGATVRRYSADVNGGVSSDVFEEATDTGINTRTEVAVAGARCYLDGTDRYLIYCDTGSDVHMYSNTGSGWTDLGDLDATETWQLALPGWQYNNLNNTTTIDIIAVNSTGSLYYLDYQLSAAPRRVFVTHVG